MNAIQSRLTGRPLEIILTATNSAAQSWYGYDQGVTGGILISEHFHEQFPLSLDPDIQGLIVSCFSLGNVIGCLLVVLFGDQIGRKNTLRIGAIFCAVGVSLQIASFAFAQYIVGRIINGIGNGWFLCSFYHSLKLKKVSLAPLAGYFKQNLVWVKEEGNYQS